MSAPVYKCPASGCDTEFTAIEKDGKKCPCGKVELKYVRERKDNKLTGHYILDSDKPIPPPMPKEEPEPHPLVKAGGQRLDDGSRPPEIWKMPSETHPATGKETEMFKVFYRNVVYQGYVFCPKCRKKLWRNIYLHTTSGQETVCERCRSKIEFHFNVPVRMGINS